ncbi:hypothetical protein SAMN05444166_7138 [Singulisphaera sp. GP187]|uniref:hypothetical protein n=1 Tax=Singulisphaera sp. GP187 TaxID=1882752 RepID=UPI000926795F|nr:hypothetical protein [Singulisphaera sp. GP187]SIO62749.1 hypothetical protein SAMN05444166_7138 [Singulisphaera sp. GP187]
MKSLIWKECHENLKWATLAALGLGGLIFVGRPTLMNPALLLFLSPIAAVSGAVLGFLQVYYESDGDKRSLLLHRPMSPSRIFLGKAVAGVGLYLLAMGIPFASYVAWVATPGHVAEPFRWQMALPGLADILTGVAYYFAGMLIALREARWYASRCLPLVAALLCSFFVWVLPEFWQAVLAIVILGAPLAVAVWGSFLTGGAFAPLPRLSKVALAVTCVTALLALGVVVKPFVWLPMRFIGLPTPRANMTRYKLDREGRVLIVRFRQGEIESLTDLEGREPPLLKGKPLSFYALQDMCAPFSADVSPGFQSYRNAGRFYMGCENNTSRDGERWFYVSDQRLLVGYDVRSSHVIGTCGPDGFVPAGKQPAARFEGEPYQHSFLLQTKAAERLSFPEGVYLVDFGSRTVRKFYSPAEGETVLGAASAVGEGRTFVLTDKSARVIHRSGTTLFSAPFAVDPDNYGVARVAQLENPERWVVRYEPSWFMFSELGNITSGQLVEYDPAGREVARGPLPPTPMHEPSDAQALLGLITPPAEAALLTWATEHSIDSARQNGGREVQPLLFLLVVLGQWFNPLGAGVAPGSGTILAYRGLILLSALACALVCFLLARRASSSRAGRLVWTLCGLLFGPAGLLLMLAVEEWPARVACPKCGKPRVVTRDACEHCGVPHAPAAPDGTEIFDSIAAAMYV